MERCQHVTGWTWKHKDFDKVCPNISPLYKNKNE